MSGKANFWAREAGRQLKLPSSMRAILKEMADCHNQETNRCDPSIAHIHEYTGYDRKTIMNAIEKLEEMSLIASQKRAGARTKYQFNFNHESIETSTKIGTSPETGTSTRTGTQTSTSFPTNQYQNWDTNLKEPKTKPKRKSAREKILNLVLPDNLEISDWQEWIDYLAQKKKLPVEKTAQAQLKKLAKSPNPRAMIEHCIEKGWQGLFEPDTGVKNNGQPKKSAYERVLEADREYFG